MKYINIKLLVLAGLVLQVGIGCAHDWEATGPTREDIKAATGVENRAVKGSLEDKLICAVKAGDSKSFEEVMAQDVDLEARDDASMTALMIAAQKGCTDIAGKLIAAGANIGAQGKYDDTPLFYAFDNGHIEIVKLLIAQGAAQYQKDFEELHMVAMLQGNDKMANALQGTKADS